MPPEQARGEGDQVSPKSDIFGLGAVLYETLTGRPPFEGQTLLEVLDRARRCDFDAGALWSSEVPWRLERICLRAMAPAPIDRYDNAQVFAEDLERYARWARWSSARRLMGLAVAVLLAPAALAVAACFMIVGLAGAPLLAPWTPAVAVWFWSHQPPLDENPERPDVAADKVDADTTPAPVARTVPGPLAIEQSEPMLEIQRDGKLYDLKGALPLRTGDRLRIVCDVPHGLSPTFFWLGSDGTLEVLDGPAVKPGGETDRHTYPEPGRVVPLTGPPGTELVLIHASKTNSIDHEELKALLGAGQPWPMMLPNTRIVLDRDRVELKIERGLGVKEPGFDVGKVQSAAEKLREGLRDNAAFLSGVAFPHVDPAAAAK